MEVSPSKIWGGSTCSIWSYQMVVCEGKKTESDLVVLYSHQDLVSDVLQARITKQKEEEKKAEAKAEEALKLRGSGWESYTVVATVLGAIS